MRTKWIRKAGMSGCVDIIGQYVFSDNGIANVALVYASLGTAWSLRWLMCLMIKPKLRPEIFNQDWGGSLIPSLNSIVGSGQNSGHQ